MEPCVTFRRWIDQYGVHIEWITAGRQQKSRRGVTSLCQSNAIADAFCKMAAVSWCPGTRAQHRSAFSGFSSEWDIYAVFFLCSLGFLPPFSRGKKCQLFFFLNGVAKFCCPFAESIFKIDGRSCAYYSRQSVPLPLVGWSHSIVITLSGHSTEKDGLLLHSYYTLYTFPSCSFRSTFLLLLLYMNLFRVSCSIYIYIYVCV